MQVPQEEDEEEAVTKKAIKELEIFISQIFYSFLYLFIFFNYFTLSLFFFTFFTHDIYPHPHPRPTTSTHDPRPKTFSYTLYNFVLHIVNEEKKKPQFIAPGLTNNNNNKNTTKQQQQQITTILYKFLSLGRSELSDCNLNNLDKKFYCLTPGLSKRTQNKPS